MKDTTLFRGRDEVTTSGLLRCLESVGAADCRLLYVHSEMSFGKPNPELGKTGLLQAVLDTLLELGVPTLCVPTFTFSFCNGVPYDATQSRSKMGVFNEYVRRLPQAERSIDPLMSAAVLGDDHQVVRDLGHHSIGAASTFDKIHALGHARFLFLGVGAAKCFTYTHYVEERLRVPYRYDRDFTGTVIHGDDRREDTYTLYVRYNGVVPESTTKFEDFLVREGLMKKVACGDNFVSSIAEPVAYETIAGKIGEDGGYFLAAPPPDRKDMRFELQHEMVAL
ncbi:MAG TPA: AAC(3) family N-acetyltransferase [Kofleriaceae bacterium]|nr:AAC(3) family N-acetyltransferase [Kofleriaceae bacterium]